MIGSGLGQHLLADKIPLKLFQALNFVCNDPASNEFKDAARLKLDQCLYLIVSNADDDIRYEKIAVACKS